MPPVRRAFNRGKNIVGYFPSVKTGRMVNFESLLERDFIVLLDFEPQVTSFAEQPFHISYQVADKTHKYTPDFYVVSAGYNWVCECKPVRFQDTPENLIKFAAAHAWCETRGWSFRVITDEQLSGWRVKNIKLLTQFARHPVHASLQTAILQAVACSSEVLCIGQVTQLVNPAAPQTILIPLLYLAYHHKIHLPLNDFPINLQTPISLRPISPPEVGLI